MSVSSGPAVLSGHPRLRPDVSVWPLFEARDGEEATFIVGSRERNRFLTVPAGKLALVEQALAALDGTRTADEIERRLAATTGTRVDVGRLCRLLEENGLLEGADASRVRRQHIERLSLPLFHLPVEGAFAALRRLGLGWVSWLAWASGPVVVAGIVLALRDGVLGIVVERYVHGGSGPTGVGLSVALMLLSFAGHEVAHGVVALRHGVTPRRFEACLYLGIVPLFFLRIPGLYTLPRAERLKVWSAGIVWNLLAGSSCILAIDAGVVPMSARPVVLVVALANYSMALFNLVPFLPTDGYFLLSTAMRRHNVREHAWRELARWASGREHRLSGLLLLHVAGVSASLAWVLHRNLVALRQGTWGAPGPWLSLALFLVSLVLILGPFVRHLRRAPEGLKPAGHAPQERHMKNLSALRVVLVVVSVACPSALLSGPDLHALASAPAERRDALQAVVAAEPSNAEAHYLLAKALYDLRDYDLAEEPAQRAVELRPGEARHHLLLGRVTAARIRRAGLLKKFAMARKIRSEFEAAVAADPRDFDARLALTAFYAEAPWIVGGGIDKAMAQAREIAALSPMEGHLAQAEVHESRRQWSDVERELRQAVAAEPSSAKAHARLAVFLFQNKKVGEAEPLFRRCLELDADLLSPYYYLGRLQAERGESLATAEAHLRKYLTRWPEETSPSWAAAHWFLSRIYEAQGRKDLAAAETKEVYRLAPGFKPPAACNCSF